MVETCDRTDCAISSDGVGVATGISSSTVWRCTACGRSWRVKEYYPGPVVYGRDGVGRSDVRDPEVVEL